MEFVIALIVFFLVLIALVIIHELGHFVAAKLQNIKVEEFGFGIPPRIFGKKWGETLYSLNWLPIGGFVRVYGEDIDDPKKITKDRERAFFAKPPWRRAIVLVAGVVMNLVLAWGIFTVLLTTEEGLLVPAETVTVNVVLPDMPAEAAGMQADDQILAITDEDGRKYSLNGSKTVNDIVSQNEGRELDFLVIRNEQEQTVTVVPSKKSDDGPVLIGIEFTPFVHLQADTWYQAIPMGFKVVFQYLWLIISFFGSIIAGFFQPNVPAGEQLSESVGGPVKIFEFVKSGFEVGGARTVLEITAFLSINLALLNILPFPALDGGRLMFVIYEWITGKRVKAKWEAYTHQIGMLFLLLLLLVITAKDLAQVFGF